MSNELTTQQSQSSLAATANSVIFSVEHSGALMQFGDFMSQGGVMLPDHLRGNAPACTAVAMQAAAWNMNPFAVAQKTHLVNGTLGYEAQLVNAVVSSSRAIRGRFHYRTIGDWSKWAYQAKKIQKQGKNGAYTVETHGGANEKGLGIQVGAVLAGETEITWDDVLYIENIEIRNSPLWKSRPLQQMKYLGVKYWARIYCPEILLGVYTPDELYTDSEFSAANGTEKVVNDELADVISGGSAHQESKSESEANQESSGEFEEFTQQDGEPNLSVFDEYSAYIKEASTKDEMDKIGRDIFTAQQSGDLSNQEVNRLREKFTSRQDELGIERKPRGGK